MRYPNQEQHAQAARGERQKRRSALFRAHPLHRQAQTKKEGEQGFELLLREEVDEELGWSTASAAFRQAEEAHIDDEDSQNRHAAQNVDGLHTFLAQHGPDHISLAGLPPHLEARGTVSPFIRNESAASTAPSSIVTP